MKSVTTLEELDALDPDLMLQGYRAGLGFIPVNHTVSDQAYWHGYWNGQVDTRQVPISPEQQELARKVVERVDFAVIFGSKQ